MIGHKALPGQCRLPIDSDREGNHEEIDQSSSASVDGPRSELQFANMISNVDETRLLNPALSAVQSEPRITAYATRFYILFCFVVFCVLQAAMWNFYSPINAPLEQVYGWSDDFIEWLGNSASISFCVLVIPTAAAIDLKGMRWSILLTIVALCINAGLRCIPLSWIGESGMKAACMISMIFNGMSLFVLMDV
jgi:hypothetical protein